MYKRIDPSKQIDLLISIICKEVKIKYGPLNFDLSQRLV